MKVPNKVRITFYLLGFAGAALFIGLLIREGAPQVGKAIATAGWAIIAVIAFHFLVPVLLDTLAWWVLFPKAERPSLPKLYRMRWIGESVTTLVPSAAVGGDIVRARLAAISGTPIATAAATVLVDLTLGVFTQAAFTILGIALLVSATGSKDFVRPTLIGTVVGVVAVCGFYFVQRAGMFRFLARMIAKIANSPEWHSLIESGETLDTTVRALYARRAAVFACCGWTIVSLILNSGEIYIALWALNLHPTILNAIILQSMALTIRSAAFAVPGGIGVQEGGYVFVACLLGLASDAFKCGEIGFALSAISRVRELAFGIPGLITWQLIEGRRLIRSRAAAITS
jgi:putative membrane protein